MRTGYVILAQKDLLPPLRSKVILMARLNKINQSSSGKIENKPTVFDKSSFTVYTTKDRCNSVQQFYTVTKHGMV